MSLTIAVISLIFIACVIVAYKMKGNLPAFTDEQLLVQHRRFLAELESSKKYIGATYFNSVEKGSPAQAELKMRGYDIEKLLRECNFAEQEDRPMKWEACKASTKPPSADDIRGMQG
jgi:hypothetical protein